MEDRLTAQEVASLLGISVSAVHRLCARGTLGSAMFAGRRVFQRQIILALKNSAGYSKRTRRRTFQDLLDDGTVRQGVIEL